MALRHGVRMVHLAHGTLDSGSHGAMNPELVAILDSNRGQCKQKAEQIQHQARERKTKGQRTSTHLNTKSS